MNSVGHHSPVELTAGTQLLVRFFNINDEGFKIYLEVDLALLYNVIIMCSFQCFSVQLCVPMKGQDEQKMIGVKGPDIVSISIIVLIIYVSLIVLNYTPLPPLNSGAFKFYHRMRMPQLVVWPLNTTWKS